jgi:hypothetical protein
MPVRRRLRQFVGTEPDPRSRWTWASGDGCGPILTGDVGYRNERAARRAWDSVGRLCMWQTESIGRVPAAASNYDGVTEQAHAAAALAGLHQVYDSRPVLKAITADRASVRDFRDEHPRAARQIAEYLDQYVAWLDRLEEYACRIHGTADGPDRRWKESPLRFSGHYGGRDEETYG